MVEYTAPEVKGELKLYSCPKILCSPVEWALSDLFKSKITLTWKQQQIAPTTFSTELRWFGPVGLGAKIVSALSKWPNLRLEVFQERFNEHPAERYALCPNLGIFRAELNSLGETIVSESRLRAALERSKSENETFEIELAFILGLPWDENLEPFRKTYEIDNLKWINKTG